MRTCDAQDRDPRGSSASRQEARVLGTCSDVGCIVYRVYRTQLLYVPYVMNGCHKICDDPLSMFDDVNVKVGINYEWVWQCGIILIMCHPLG